jgi:hypothetical protein
MKYRYSMMLHLRRTDTRQSLKDAETCAGPSLRMLPVPRMKPDVLLSKHFDFIFFKSIRVL